MKMMEDEIKKGAEVALSGRLYEHIAVRPSTFAEFRRLKDEKNDDIFVQKLCRLYKLYKQNKQKQDKEVKE